MHRAPVSTARRFVSVFLLTLMTISIVFGLAVMADSVLATEDTASVVVTSVVEEDSPGWDCQTMGNGVCAGELVPDVETFEDGSSRVSCPAYGDLIERNGVLVCVGD